MLDSLSSTLTASFNRRLPFADSRETYRLFDGAGDGFPNLFIDRYGSVALIHYLPADGKPLRQASSEIVSEIGLTQSNLREQHKITSCCLRVHAHDARHNRNTATELLFGSSCDEILVQEHKLNYLVRPTHSLQAGLYLDMRDLRYWLLNNSAGKRVLNFFCFTGSLGLAALAGGAEQVVQIDSSPTVLDWAKKNLALNSNLSAQSMRFVSDDCFNYLKHEQNRVQHGGARADIIVIDPPSFGRGRKRIFSLKQQASELLEMSIDILAPGGIIIFSSNTRTMTANKMGQLLTDACKHLHWQPKLIEPIFPPVDEFRSSGLDSIAMRGVRACGK